MGVYTVGVYTLGVYTLGVYTLGVEQPISDLAPYMLVLKKKYKGPYNINVVAGNKSRTRRRSK